MNPETEETTRSKSEKQTGMVQHNQTDAHHYGDPSEPQPHPRCAWKFKCVLCIANRLRDDASIDGLRPISPSYRERDRDAPNSKLDCTPIHKGRRCQRSCMRLQSGQSSSLLRRRLCLHQLRMHFPWKPWPHCRCLMGSPASRVNRHTAHDDSLAPARNSGSSCSTLTSKHRMYSSLLRLKVPSSSWKCLRRSFTMKAALTMKIATRVMTRAQGKACTQMTDSGLRSEYSVDDAEVAMELSASTTPSAKNMLTNIWA